MNILIFALLLISSSETLKSASPDSISTIDFVQVLNGNNDEALFYYTNNWKQLRETALELEYIESYSLLEVTPTEDAPFTFMLITTYANQTQYENAEKNFREIIESQGELKLMNDKKPNEFRKTIFSKTEAAHH